MRLWRWLRAFVRWWFTDEGPESEADREGWALQRRQWSPRNERVALVRTPQRG